MDSSQATTDEQGPALARLRDEGRAALAELFSKERNRLRRMVDVRLDRRIAGRIDPSDILQEAYLDAARQMDQYLEQPPMPLFHWFRFLTGQRLMATHRQHLGTQKRDAKQERTLYPDVPYSVSSESLSCQLISRLPTPAQDAQRQEMQVWLTKTLDTLDAMDREVLSLRHFEELTNNEAAREMGITPAAASKRYVRALERLRKILPSLTDSSGAANPNT